MFLEVNEERGGCGERQSPLRQEYSEIRKDGRALENKPLHPSGLLANQSPAGSRRQLRAEIK